MKKLTRIINKQEKNVRAQRASCYCVPTCTSLCNDSASFTGERGYYQLIADKDYMANLKK